MIFSEVEDNYYVRGYAAGLEKFTVETEGTKIIELSFFF